MRQVDLLQDVVLSEGLQNGHVLEVGHFVPADVDVSQEVVFPDDIGQLQSRLVIEIGLDKHQSPNVRLVLDESQQFREVVGAQLALDDLELLEMVWKSILEERL